MATPDNYALILTSQGKGGRRDVICHERREGAKRVSEDGATMPVRTRACGLSMADAAATKTGFVRKGNAKEDAVSRNQLVIHFLFDSIF